MFKHPDDPIPIMLALIKHIIEEQSASNKLLAQLTYVICQNSAMLRDTNISEFKKVIQYQDELTDMIIKSGNLLEEIAKRNNG